MADLSDGGWTSRKLWLAMYAIGSLSVIALASAKWPAILPAFTTLCGSVVSIYTIYCGGSALHKHIAKTALKDPPPAQ